MSSAFHAFQKALRGFTAWRCALRKNPDNPDAVGVRTVHHGGRIDLNILADEYVDPTVHAPDCVTAPPLPPLNAWANAAPGSKQRRATIRIFLMLATRQGCGGRRCGRDAVQSITGHEAGHFPLNGLPWRKRVTARRIDSSCSTKRARNSSCGTFILQR
jgi:hypothetical protein